MVSQRRRSLGSRAAHRRGAAGEEPGPGGEQGGAAAEGGDTIGVWW